MSNPLVKIEEDDELKNMSDYLIGLQKKEIANIHMLRELLKEYIIENSYRSKEDLIIRKKYVDEFLGFIEKEIETR